jgi:glycosyltransferase involved in cell wall biosynthesis
VKVLFVNENIGGHATVHHHLRAALELRSDVEAVFVDGDPPGPFRRVVGASLPVLGKLDLDLQPLRAQLAHSAHLRRSVQRLAETVDVVHVYSQNAALSWPDVLRRHPSVVSSDTTNMRNAYRLPYRRPTRFTPHALRPTLFFERRVLDAADLVIANSEWAAESMQQDYQVGPDRLEVFPFGITAPATPQRRELSRPSIAFLGRQFDRKGGRELVEAWRRWCSDRADLVLITQDRLQPEPGVRVINDLEPGDGRLWDVLADVSILAFPSTIDQAPNAVIEAMASALPVVAGPTAAVVEMVVDGETGLLVQPDDVDALGRALARLVDDAALRRRLGDAARRRFEERYDATASTDRLIDVLHRARRIHGS